MTLSEFEDPRPSSPWEQEAPAGARRSVDPAVAIRARKREQFRDLVSLLALAVDFDDGTNQRHSWRVGVLARELGRALHIDPGLLFYGGLVHDVGALQLQQHVVQHAQGGFHDAGARMHPGRGAGLVRLLSSLRSLEAVVAHHHERWDGGGFPDGLSTWQIPVGSAVIAFADGLEIALRGVHTDQLLMRAVQFVWSSRETLCPSEVCEAALRLFEADPSLLGDLYDNEALERRVRAPAEELEGLALVSEVELVAELLWLIARAIDAKHAYSSGHSARVAFHAQNIAARLDGEIDRWDVVCAGLVHDVGKIVVPRSVLDKTSPLTDGERRLIQSHASETRRVLESLGSLKHLALAASSHHEAYDGSGYPAGLSGESIPLIARILAYADVYDALRSDRSFRGGMARDEAFATMKTMVGRTLDPSLAPIAFEALAMEPDLAAVGSDPLGYQRFFRSGEPGVMRQSPDDTADPIVPEAAQWRTLRIRADGVILLGATSLAALTDCASDRVHDHFAETTRAKLADELGRVTRGETVATSHATPSGRRIELVLGLLGDDIVAHARRASHVWRSMREIALVHRNFLLSSEAVVFTDATAHIVDVNYAFTRMFGWRAEEVIGRTPKLLQSGLHPPAMYKAMRESLVDPHVGAWSGEIVNLTKSGDHVVVQLTVNSVRDASGGVVGYVSNAVDVTARRKAQDALEARERDLVRKNAELERLNQFKSQMVAITSHDLRSPLASMIGLAELLRDAGDGVAREDVTTRLGMIADVGHRLVDLVNDLLDLDKCESGTLRIQPRRVRTRGVVDAIAAAPAAMGRVAALPTTCDVTFLADAERLEQALQNLVGNALKFSPASTAVELSCEQRDRGLLRFCVADRGPGVPEVALGSVFDRYYQVEREGAHRPRGAGIGLGLAIVRHIADLHGGRAYAENREGGGCRFFVEIPACGPDPAVLPPPSALLVGPRSDDMQLATRVFAASGLRVLHADRVAEAGRRLSIEAPLVLVIDARWIAEGLDEPLRHARERGATVVAIRQEEPTTRDARFDWELLSPVMDIELAAFFRGVMSRANGGLR